MNIYLYISLSFILFLLSLMFFFLFFFLILPVPPIIEPFSFQEGLSEGLRTRAVCGVSRGDPPISISWLKDGSTLSLRGVNVSALDLYSSLLSISSLASFHSGDYTCVASNPAAQVRFTAKLQVKGKLELSCLSSISSRARFLSLSLWLLEPQHSVNCVALAHRNAS